MLCATCHAETSGDPCPTCRGPALLDGRYRLLEEIGRGRWGRTFRAEHTSTHEITAIKIVSTMDALEPKVRQLLRRETAVLRQLRHPNIPSYVEHFELREAGRHRLCIVQEYVQGPTLAQEFVERRYAQDEVLDMLEALLDILGYLHGLSPPVIHRDIKPGNIIRRASDGRLVLIDFGAVREALQDPELGGSTVAGTFGYMAPEQFRGDADARTDFYALGATAAFLLTRREPRALLDHRNQLRFQPHLSARPGVFHLLESLLDPDPAGRPRDVRATLTLIRSARPGAVPSRPAPSPNAPPRVATRERVREEPFDFYQPPAVAEATALAKQTRARALAEVRQKRQVVVMVMVVLLMLAGLWVGVLTFNVAPAPSSGETTQQIEVPKTLTTPEVSIQPSVDPGSPIFIDLPQGIEIHDVADLGGDLSMWEGVAPSTAAIASLLSTMESADALSEVYLIEVVTVTEGGADLKRFVLRFKNLTSHEIVPISYKRAGRVPGAK